MSSFQTLFLRSHITSNPKVFSPRYFGHISKVTTETILPDTEIRFTCPQFPGLHLFPDLVPGSHIHSLQLNVVSQTLRLLHTSAVSRLTPFLDPVPGSHVHSLQSDTLSQTLYLELHFHNIHGDTPAQSCIWCHISTVSSIISLPDPLPGIILPQSLV